MQILIDSIALSPNKNIDDIASFLGSVYGLPGCSFKLLKKSLDSRKRNNIVYRYKIIAEVTPEQFQRIKHREDVKIHTLSETNEPPKSLSGKTFHIIGTGPAGLFCGLRLISHGARVIFFEQGKPVEERFKDIRHLEKSGTLDTESNVLFGEGGAGTYSDGKLYTRSNRPESEWIYNKLLEYGAPEEIAWDSHPHIGTDRLADVIKNIRFSILSAGSEIFFQEKITDFRINSGKCRGFITSAGREISAENLILAIGHSARDTLEVLYKNNVAMEKKGFAAGVRLEHPAELINQIQYGKDYRKYNLPAAEYRLVYTNPETGRGIYSFCMCPGGRIINSSSEPGGLCTNGMSNSKRDYEKSNAAIVVTVRPEDCPDGPLGGIEFQRELESKAFLAGGGEFYAPVQKLTSFLSRKHDRIDSGITSSYLPGIRPASLAEFLPEWIVSEMKRGIQSFERKMCGFITGEAVMAGVETRTSSPVRVLRGEDFQCVNTKGLYAIGEGAGYAGGIISSAVDGVRCADAIAEKSGL